MSTARDTIRFAILACAILGLICWNVMLQADVKALQSMEETSSAGNQHKRSLSNLQNGGGGATYIRWGRTVCPGDAERAYKGFAGGQHFQDIGGAAEYICLVDEPKYATYTSINTKAWVFGVELQLDGASILDTTNSDPNPLLNTDVQCAVCRSRTRTSKIMIPGTKECSPGWTMEYWGYLMTQHQNHKGKHGYACLDHAPEAGTDGGARDDDGALMYFVQASCPGSLPCKPYVRGRQLTCVVCTK